jgi:nicotinate-nucleotide adenylyltransferase
LARLALYGGTFDPFHLGHLAVVRAARDLAGMDEVLVIPALRSPHKLHREGADAEWRLWLAVLGTLEEPGVRVERWELDRPAPSYALDTWEAACRARGSDHEWWWIIGADQLPGLRSWHRIDRLLEGLRFLVVPREPWTDPQGEIVFEEVIPASWRPRIEVLPMPPIAISATEVRAQLTQGRSVAHLVPRLTALCLERYNRSLAGHGPSLDRLDHDHA